MFNNPIYESAFKQLDILCEQDFNLKSDSAEKIRDFMDEEETDADVDVIDLDAETEDDLDESNIGKIILQCPCCETIVCKNSDEIELPDDCDDDENCMVQVGEQCPVCFSEEGYKIIGKVAPYEEVEVEIEPKDNDDDIIDDEEDLDGSEDEDFGDEMETDFDDAESEVDDEDEDKKKNESLNEPAEGSTLNEECNSDSDNINCNEDCKESLDEGLNDINLETDTDRISIHAEQKAENGEEMIAPLDFLAANEIVDNQPSNEEEDDYLNDIEVPEDNEISEENIDAVDELPEDDVDINDFDEKSFDDLGESYFKSVYDNVTSYLTEKVHEQGDNLIVEGIITFDSGNLRRTLFVLEGNQLAASGKCSMLAENLLITPGLKAFNINGTLSNGKFISESLSYNYNNGDTKIEGNINIR